MILMIIIAAFCGMIVGAAFSRAGENKCPLRELGYSCKWETGRECDHRKSELYKAKATMAQNDEEWQNHNYWNGGQ